MAAGQDRYRVAQGNRTFSVFDSERAATKGMIVGTSFSESAAKEMAQSYNRGEVYHGNSDLERLAIDLEAAARALPAAAGSRLAVVGERVVARAKRNAGAYRSHASSPRSNSRTSGTSRSGTQAVVDSIHGHLESEDTFRISYGEGVPLAGLWELGNRGGHEGDHEFRHPLFGNSNFFYPQPKHPFMAPALAEEAGPMIAALETTWDRVLGPVGLEPESTTLANIPAYSGANVGRVPAGYPGGQGGQFFSFRG